MCKTWAPGVCTATITVLLLSASVAADNKKGTAIIKGRVVYDGVPPPPRALPLRANAPGGKHKPDQGTIVYKHEGNAIPYVFVHVTRGVQGKYKPPNQPLVIDVRDGQFRPHVQGMVAGQAIEFRNLDPVNENIQSLSSKNPRLLVPLPAGGGPPVKLTGKATLQQPEVMIKLQSVMRAWMQSYIGVCPHPFFDVTKSHDDSKADSDIRGTFEIKDLPAGDYELEFVHETFGRLTKQVSVKDGETKELVVRIGPAQKSGDGKAKS